MKQILVFGGLLLSVVCLGQIPNLQQVTTQGNTTATEIVLSGYRTILNHQHAQIRFGVMQPSQPAGNWGMGLNGSLNGNFFIFNGITNAVPFTIKPNDNVGIGTQDPQAKLEVNGDIKQTDRGMTFLSGTHTTLGEAVGGAQTILGNSVRVSPTIANSLQKLTYDAGQFQRFLYTRGITFHTGLTGAPGTVYNCDVNERMVIDNIGNVGIGTPSPQAKLEVTANSQTLFRAFNANANIIIGNGGTGDNFFEGTTHYFRDAVGNQKMNIQSSSINTYVPIISNQAILVGTSTIPSGYLMAVNGNFISQKVVVKQNIFADYVFKPDYKLRPLSEVEQFINQNGHLPNIPKEEEVKKNGLDLGDMNVKLLEKVEELTLYMIEMKKENETLKKQNQEILHRLEKVGKQ